MSIKNRLSDLEFCLKSPCLSWIYRLASVYCLRLENLTFSPLQTWTTNQYTFRVVLRQAC